MSLIKEQLEIQRQEKNKQLDATYKVSLYNILDAKDFIARIENEDGLEEYSKSIEIQKEEKINAIGGFLKETELMAFIADSESKRLAELAKYYGNRAKKIKQSVTWAMVAHEKEELKTGLFRFSFRKSESVLVDDVDQLPEEYTVTKKSANKVAIKKALKDGLTVEGAKIIESNNLQIN